ncbi:MAG: threonine synthase [Candidatus Eisenbacteria sp.]|nr:threonine synthase [Candidatus Eisenbacteria bacterium]
MGEPILLKCVGCGREFAPEPSLFTCPDCGPSGTLDVLYDYDRVSELLTRESLDKSREFSIWRYLPLLPVAHDTPRTPLTVGWTPLYRTESLGSEIGCPDLFLKDDGRNPTASFKDRASAVGIAKAMESGNNIITCASTGNAASSLAGLCASLGLRSVIFVPATAPRAKIAQLLVYGARIVLVEGTYDQAFDLCYDTAQSCAWYCRNTGINPYLSEGKKTAALEIAEHLNWEAPDKVFVSVGDGCIIGGLWKGFHDLLEIGLLDRMPQIIGVQAEGCQPIRQAIETGKPVEPVSPDTIADSISVGRPRDALKAVRAIRNSGGFALAVPDEEILDAMRTLGRSTGIFGEPAGVTGFAGLRQALRDGLVRSDERVVVLITGNGLKDVDSALKAVGEPPRAKPDLDEIRKVVEEHYPECL